MFKITAKISLIKKMAIVYLFTSLGTPRCPDYSWLLPTFIRPWSQITILAIFPYKSRPTLLKILKQRKSNPEFSQVPLQTFETNRSREFLVYDRTYKVWGLLPISYLRIYLPASLGWKHQLRSGWFHSSSQNPRTFSSTRSSKDTCTEHRYAKLILLMPKWV